MKRPDPKDYDYQPYGFMNESAKYMDYLEDEIKKARRHILNMINLTGEMRSEKDMKKMNDAWDWIGKTNKTIRRNRNDT